MIGAILRGESDELRRRRRSGVDKLDVVDREATVKQQAAETYAGSNAPYVQRGVTAGVAHVHPVDLDACIGRERYLTYGDFGSEQAR